MYHGGSTLFSDNLFWRLILPSSFFTLLMHSHFSPFLVLLLLLIFFPALCKTYGLAQILSYVVRQLSISLMFVYIVNTQV